MLILTTSVLFCVHDATRAVDVAYSDDRDVGTACQARSLTPGLPAGGL